MEEFNIKSKFKYITKEEAQKLCQLATDCLHILGDNHYSITIKDNYGNEIDFLDWDNITSVCVSSMEHRFEIVLRERQRMENT